MFVEALYVPNINVNGARSIVSRYCSPLKVQFDVEKSDRGTIVYVPSGGRHLAELKKMFRRLPKHRRCVIINIDRKEGKETRRDVSRRRKRNHASHAGSLSARLKKVYIPR